jgi:hypothetical protein
MSSRKEYKFFVLILYSRGYERVYIVGMSRTAASFKDQGPVFIPEETMEDTSTSNFLPFQPKKTTFDVIKAALTGRLDDQSIRQLCSIKYQRVDSGGLRTSEALLIDGDDQEHLFEIINLLREYPADQAVKYIQKFVSSGGDKPITWYFPDSFEYALQFNHNYKISREVPEGSAYEGPCKRQGCKSTTFMKIEIQAASWDEPPKHKIICMRCGIRFNE